MFARRIRTNDLLSQFPKLARFAMYLAEDEPGAGGGGGSEGDDDGGEPDPKDQKIAELVAEATKYHKQRQTLQQQLDGLQDKVLSDEDRELYESLKAEKAEAEEASKKAAGKYDELLAAKEKTYAERIAARDKKAAEELAEEKAKGATFREAYQAVAVRAPIQAELAKYGVKNVEAAAHLIQTLHPQHATATLDASGRAIVQVVDREGNLVIDGDCGPDESVGIDKLVEGFVATDTGKAFLPPSGDTGSGSHKGGLHNTVPYAELVASPDKRAEFIEKHGGKAWVDLAAKNRKSTKT